MHPPDSRGDFKRQVLDATDLVALVGRATALKKRNKDFWGCCPFHNEKSASFKVDPVKRFYYCFGCKETGNAIDFVMKQQRLPFIDALKQLGREAGLEMPQSGMSKEKASERQVVLEANSAACAFFEKRLAHPEQGRAARDYLQNRGIDADSVRRFQIGFAADGWDGLLKSESMRKFAPPQLAQAGLAKKREKGDGFYDTFRNRLMFPIRDEGGRVIAFGGRIMPGSQDPAKYLNSPETEVFKKSQTVFGIDLARQRIVETGTVVIVEGYTDVVMAHQFGVTNVVSVLGTAMTEAHVRLLNRYLPDEGGRIVLLFDADAAGETAVDRTVSLFLTQPVDMAIAALPNGLDPDEFLLKEGAAGWERMVAAAPDALTYKWKELVQRYNDKGDDLTGQQSAVSKYLELLAGARGSGPVSPVRWGMALARVSRLTNIPVEQLNREFRKVNTIPVAERGQGAAGSRLGGSGSSSSGVSVAATTSGARAPGRALTARERAERWILGALLLQPARWMQVQKFVGVEDFTDADRRQVAELYWGYQRDEGEPVFNEFLEFLGNPTHGGSPALQAMAVETVAEVEALSDADSTLAETIEFLQQSREARDTRRLVETFRRAGSEVKADSEADLINRLRALQEKAKQPDLRRS